MIFSVYQYGSKSYDYYDDGQPSTTHAGAPPLGSTSSADIGRTPEASAWRVPIGATKIGSGEMPRGRVASMGGVAEGGGGLVKYGALACAVYLAWRYLR